MTGAVLWFPIKLDGPDGDTIVAEETSEPCAAFVKRMTREAMRYADGSPSAAVVFLYAAARRLHREALERAGMMPALPPPPRRKRGGAA